MERIGNGKVSVLPRVSRDDTRSPCVDPEQHIATTWSAARTSALQDAFVASGSRTVAISARWFVRLNVAVPPLVCIATP